MTKAKQDKMKCLFQLYSFNLNLNHGEKSGRKRGDLVTKEKMLVVLVTISVTISSPEFILLIMPVMCPYLLWNLKNYLCMTKSQLRA